MLEEILSFRINGLVSLESLLLKTLFVDYWDLSATAGNQLLRKTTGFSATLG